MVLERLDHEEHTNQSRFIYSAPEHALCCNLMNGAVIAGLGIRTNDSGLLELAYLVQGKMFA